MRLGESVEWAAHCAAVLAVVPEGYALSATTLADFHGIPKPYLAKALQALSRAGIVRSTPGRRGGYWLARPAKEVSLLDVVLAVQGDERAFRCTEIRQRMPTPAPPSCFSQACAIASAMWKAEDAWRASLAEVSIADISRSVSQIVPTSVMESNAVWLSQRIGRR